MNNSVYLLPSKKINKYICDCIMIFRSSVLLALLATHNLEIICVWKISCSTMVTQAWSCNQSMQLFSSMPEDLLTNEATDRSFALLNMIVASLRVSDFFFFFSLFLWCYTLFRYNGFLLCYFKWEILFVSICCYCKLLRAMAFRITSPILFIQNIFKSFTLDFF